jgi:hypothetical protein
MESGDGARRVKQRQLLGPEETRAEPPAPAVAPWTPSADLPPPVPPPMPPISREPSGVTLRERQARWLRERARFEAAERESSRSSEGSK